ncbi:MAG: hypothetical protein ABIQ73_20175 [Acidimicrobiales bacterium]
MLLITTAASAVIFGLCLILVAVTLGRCDAFGGRCPADNPSLLDDDVFGMAAFGAFLVVAVPSFLYRPSRQRLLKAIAIGIAAGLFVGLTARSSVR